MRDIIEERLKQNRQIESRHPWARKLYDGILILVVMCLFASLFSWYVDIQNAAIAFAEKQEAEKRIAEEQLRQEEAERQELEKTLDRWATAGARQLYGIRNFIEKYHYTEKDLITYLRCPWNRYLNNKKLTDLDVVIYKPEQFLACSESNQVLSEYKALARKCFAEWRTETELPCDTSYTFAELTPNGIYLVNEFNANGYVRRWHV